MLRKWLSKTPSCNDAILLHLLLVVVSIPWGEKMRKIPKMWQLLYLYVKTPSDVYLQRFCEPKKPFYFPQFPTHPQNQMPYCCWQ